MSCISMSSICIYDVNTTIENVRVSQCTQIYMQMNTHLSNTLGCSLMDRHTWLLDRYTCHVTVYSCVSVQQQTCGSVHVTCIFPAANDPVHCIYIVDTYILHPYVVCTYITTICAPHSFISFAAYASTYTRTYTQMYDPYLSVCLYLYVPRMQPSNLHIYIIFNFLQQTNQLCIYIVYTFIPHRFISMPHLHKNDPKTYVQIKTDLYIDILLLNCEAQLCVHAYIYIYAVHLPLYVPYSHIYTHIYLHIHIYVLIHVQSGGHEYIYIYIYTHIYIT